MTADDVPSLTGRRVLLVEDDPADAYIYRTALARAGANVSVMTDGRTVVAASESGFPFDVIVLDLTLPGVRGTELTALLRGRGFSGAIVGISAAVTEDIEELWRAAGCDVVARKTDCGLTPFVRLVIEACVFRDGRRR